MFKRSLIAALCAALLAFPAFAAPVVGVSGVDANSDSVRAMMTLLSAKGATPVFLSNFSARDPAADAKKIDALVVMGNRYDIDPAYYGATPHPKTLSEMQTPEGEARAIYEYTLIQKALDTGMPVLGICGGHQRLNVLRGGTLHQHIPDLVGSDEHAQQLFNIPPFVPVIPVTVIPETQLSQLAGDIGYVYKPGHNAPRTIMENSMHHQAVAKVGEGLRIAAISDAYTQDGKEDNLVEAIEADPNGPFKDQFVLGVQFHPEFGASPLGGKIIDRVISSAKRFAERHQRVHEPRQILQENLLSVAPTVKEPKGALGPKSGSVTQSILNERPLLPAAGE